MCLKVAKVQTMLTCSPVCARLLLIIEGINLSWPLGWLHILISHPVCTILDSVVYIIPAHQIILSLLLRNYTVLQQWLLF